MASPVSGMKPSTSSGRRWVLVFTMAASWSPLRAAAGGEAAQVMWDVRPGTLGRVGLGGVGRVAGPRCRLGRLAGTLAPTGGFRIGDHQHDLGHISFSEIGPNPCRHNPNSTETDMILEVPSTEEPEEEGPR